ncbi:MAG: flagellar protein FlgN [Opitutae bacterium]|jgi:flagellar biosynthesis/type III secretory pathway chaperone|tara:strand:- start:5762 stop:6292 length:531 start_codon:yes stop_codon:yes gene_type:complete
MVQLAQKPNSNLSFTWEDLLTLLRDELQEYGGLVGLLNAQQQSILERRTESLMVINQSVQTQMDASQMLQKRRQGFVTSLANSLGEPGDSSLNQLVEHFPVFTQPMFQSIIEEINKIISQIKHRITQNQKILVRLTEVTDQLLSVTDPKSHSKTYNRSGDIRRLSSSNRSSLNESA